MTERPEPIFFWTYGASAKERQNAPYIEPALQEGTTPLVKMMAGRYTRNFTNFRHPEITDADYGGTAVILDGPRKLIVGPNGAELYDLKSDPAEKQDLAKSKPRVTQEMGRQLRDWQTSVLESLSGADY